MPIYVSISDIRDIKWNSTSHIGLKWVNSMHVNFKKTCVAVSKDSIAAAHIPDIVLLMKLT